MTAISELFSFLKENPNTLIVIGAIIAVFSFISPAPFPGSVVYSGPVGNFRASGPSEVGISIGLIILCVGIAVRLIGTKNAYFKLSGKTLSFRTRK